MFKVWFPDHNRYGNNGEPFYTTAAAKTCMESEGLYATLWDTYDQRVIVTYSPKHGFTHHGY